MDDVAAAIFSGCVHGYGGVSGLVFHHVRGGNDDNSQKAHGQARTHDRHRGAVVHGLVSL